MTFEKKIVVEKPVEPVKELNEEVKPLFEYAYTYDFCMTYPLLSLYNVWTHRRARVGRKREKLPAGKRSFKLD